MKPNNFQLIIIVTFVALLAVGLLTAGMVYQSEKNDLATGQSNNQNGNSVKSIVDQICDDTVVYSYDTGASTAMEDCSERGGIFKECDSPCGSLLTVCRMSCTVSQDIQVIEPSDQLKTYTNAALGYSIQYPTNWFLVEDEGQAYQSAGTTAVIYNFDPNNAPGRELAIDEVKYVLAAHENPDDLTAKQYVDGLKQDTGFSFGTVVSEGAVTVAGIQGYEVKWASLGDGTSTYFPGTDYIYSFEGYANLDKYDEILSTFNLL